MQGEGYWTYRETCICMWVTVFTFIPFSFFSGYTRRFPVWICLALFLFFFFILFDIRNNKVHTHMAHMQWLICASFFCQSATTLGSWNWQWWVGVCVSVSWATGVKLNLDGELRPPVPLGLTDRQQSDFEVALLSCTELLWNGHRATCWCTRKTSSTVWSTQEALALSQSLRANPGVTHLWVCSTTVCHLYELIKIHSVMLNSVTLVKITWKLKGTKTSLMLLFLWNWFIISMLCLYIHLLVLSQVSYIIIFVFLLTF